MTIEGELIVHLDWNGRQVERVAIGSTRPFVAARVLAGKTAAEAAAIVPLLFGVCAGAQGAAAAAATEAAGGRAPDASANASRECGVMLEIVQEYLQRLLIDWPLAVGRAPQSAPVAAARRRIARRSQFADEGARSAAHADLADTLDHLAAEHVFGMACASWLRMEDPAALAAWAEDRSTLPAILLDALLTDAPALGWSDVAMMPAVTREAIASVLVPAMRRDPDFARAPLWNGAPMETGALSRLHACGLVAAMQARDGNTAAVRMVARLAELALLLARLHTDVPADDAPPWVQGFALGPDEGLAAVQTARGLLLHRVHLAAGKVADYQIVAPTEWNFHPAGALARGLERTAAADEAALVRHATIAIQALDPCVACRIEVGHA